MPAWGLERCVDTHVGFGFASRLPIRRPKFYSWRLLRFEASLRWLPWRGTGRPYLWASRRLSRITVAECSASSASATQNTYLHQQAPILVEVGEGHRLHRFRRCSEAELQDVMQKAQVTNTRGLTPWLKDRVLHSTSTQDYNSAPLAKEKSRIWRILADGPLAPGFIPDRSSMRTAKHKEAACCRNCTAPTLQ